MHTHNRKRLVMILFNLFFLTMLIQPFVRTPFTELVEADSTLQLTYSSLNLDIGKTFNLMTKDYSTVTWSTSNSSIVQLDSSNSSYYITLKGLTPGTATITATNGSGEIASCTVTVAFGLNKSELSIVANQSSEVISISDNKTQAVWTSSNPEVAVPIYSNSRYSNIIKGYKAGTAIITATTADGYTATCNVTVRYPDFKFSDSSKVYTVYSKNSFGDVKSLYTSNGSTITAYSTDNQVATVTNIYSSSITITTVGIGTCQIIAIDQYGTKATCNLTITYPEFTLPNTHIELSSISASYTLEASTGEITSIENSNPAIVTVRKANYYNYRYIITPNAYGDAVISCYDTYGQVRLLNVHSTVKGMATAINIPTILTVKQTLSTKINVSLANPSTEILSGLTWSSSNPAVATVDTEGTVTGINAGVTTITCTLSNGAIYECTVTVPVKEMATTVKLPKSWTLYELQTKNITSILTYPGYQEPTGITWSSSNKKVATIDSNGKIVAKKIGTTTITCKLHNGKTYKCIVKIKDNVSLPNTLTLANGLSKRINVVARVNKSKVLSGAKWSSSNKKIATIDSTGKVTAHAIGTCKITLKRKNGRTYTTKIKVRSNSYNGYSVNSIRAGAHSYGKLYLYINSASYSNNQLVLKAVVLNNRMFKAKKFDYVYLKVYNSNGTCIASKRFNNYALNLGAYKTKVYTFKFSVKKKYDLSAENYMSLGYDYIWTYTY